VPQKDRFKDRIVNIDFIANSFLENLPYKNVYTLTLLTSGIFYGILNGIPLKVKAPCLLCLTSHDQLIVNKQQNVIAPTIKFDADFLCTLRVSEKKYLSSKSPRIKAGMKLFERSKYSTRIGLYQLNDHIYPKIIEKFFVAGSEITVQSDEFWVCRIKKYLIELLSMVDELEKTNKKTPLNAALNYIHSNYQKKITLNDLITHSFLNRESLNKEFKKKYGCTAMKYLLLYRIKISKELLTHTGLSLNEIAYSTGFSYDTYFIKQFKKIVQKNPSEYRNSTRKIALYQ
jgi:YesN/AraC family two-component response regulator